MTGSCTQANVGSIAGRNNYYTKSGDSSVNEVGLLENVRNEGTIKVDIKQSYVGGIIGTNLGELQQASNIGAVQGKWYTGGIIGSNDGSKNNGFINKDLFNGGTVSETQYVGGIVGQAMGGKFSNIGNTGTISGTDNTAGLYVGGIIGQNIRGMAYIGGKFVYYIPAINDAYNTGSISGVGSAGSEIDVGGIIGYQVYGSLTNAYNMGDVYGDKGAAAAGYVGGICGSNTATIENVYNASSVAVTSGTRENYIQTGVSSSATVTKRMLFTLTMQQVIIMIITVQNMQQPKTLIRPLWTGSLSAVIKIPGWSTAEVRQRHSLPHRCSCWRLRSVILRWR